MIMFVLSSLCIVPPVALATEMETGLFTDLKYSPESGDLDGYELYITLSREGFSATLLDCQGECSPLQNVIPVFEGNIVSFEYIDMAGEKYLFKGEVDEAGICGSFSDPELGSLGKIFLKRGQSYWNN